MLKIQKESFNAEEEVQLIIKNLENILKNMTPQLLAVENKNFFFIKTNL